MHDAVSCPHGGGKYRIPHHLCPVHNLHVGGKDGRGSLVGDADKGKEPVCLTTTDRGISDLIDDDQLCLLDVP